MSDEKYIDPVAATGPESDAMRELRRRLKMPAGRPKSFEAAAAATTPIRGGGVAVRNVISDEECYKRVWNDPAAWIGSIGKWG